MTTELVRYDAMCTAIAAAFEVDEVKDIRDRAIAIAAYARQIGNFEAEDRCAKIRLRAEKRAAQLYDAEVKAKGARGTGSNQYQEVRPDEVGAPTLADHGITSQQMSNWRKLNSIPDDQFEAYVNEQHMPTSAGVINAFFPSPTPTPVSAEALWLWGRLRDFGRDPHYALDRDPTEFFSTMTPQMIAEVIVLLPRVIAWLERAEERCPKKPAP